MGRTLDPTSGYGCHPPTEAIDAAGGFPTAWSDEASGDAGEDLRVSAGPRFGLPSACRGRGFGYGRDCLRVVSSNSDVRLAGPLCDVAIDDGNASRRPTSDIRRPELLGAKQPPMKRASHTGIEQVGAAMATAQPVAAAARCRTRSRLHRRTRTTAAHPGSPDCAPGHPHVTGPANRRPPRSSRPAQRRVGGQRISCRVRCAWRGRWCPLRSPRSRSSPLPPCRRAWRRSGRL